MRPLTTARLAVEPVLAPLALVPVFASPTPEHGPGRHFAPPRWFQVVSKHVAEAGESAPTGKLCRCGHGKAAHAHYRRGTDCSLCTCQRYDRPFLSRLGLRRSR